VELSGKHSEDIELDIINKAGQSYKIQLPQIAKAGQKVEVEYYKSFTKLRDLDAENQIRNCNRNDQNAHH